MRAMDALRANDVAQAREVPVEDRARRALAVMREGMELKRVALRQRLPELGEDEIDRMLYRWLRRDD